uniref:Uncharacterized protein n=1 Tax=viral metagenome TaxID=1070528 RepID=A0A6C0ICW1_9ZZZZ
MNSNEISNMTLINNLLKEPNAFISNMCNLYYECEKNKRNIIDVANDDDDANVVNLQISNCISLVGIQKYVLLEVTLYLVSLITINNSIKLLQEYNITIKTEQQPETNPNVEELIGGGINTSTILKSFVFLFLILSLIGGNEISDLIAGPIQEYKVNIGFGTTLDTTSPEEMMEYSKLFENNPNLGSPLKTIMSANLTEQFKQKYQQTLSKTRPITFGSLLTYVMDGDEKFEDYLREETNNGFNTYVLSANSALKKMCDNFIGKTTDELPLNLGDYFIKQLEDAEPEIETIFEENVAKITEEKEQGMIAVQEDKMNQPLIEPTMYETATSVFSSLNAYDYFFSVSTTEVVSTNGVSKLSPETKQELIEKIKENVAAELVEVKPEIAKQAVQQKATSIMQDIQAKQKSNLQKMNRKSYLNAVCTTAFGEPPSLSFDNDVLTFTSYPQSRTHIEILLRNILTWGDEVMEKTSGINQDKIRSLMEKSQAISALLTNYDLDIINTLTKGHKTTSNIQDFLTNIFSIFEKVKQNALHASLDFPITAQDNEKLMKQQQELHDSEMKQKQFETGLTQEDTKVSRESWNAFNENVGTKVAGVTETGTSVVENIVNPLLNASGDILVNGINVGGFVLNAGMSQILHTALSILLISSILAIPTIFYIAIRTGYISAYFKKRAVVKSDSTTTVPTPQIEEQTETTRLEPVSSTSNPMIKNQTRNISFFLKQQEEGEEYDPYHDYTIQITSGGKGRGRRRRYTTKTHKKSKTRKNKSKNVKKTVKRHRKAKKTMRTK